MAEPMRAGFAADMLALIERVCDELPPPPVRALHLPPAFVGGVKDAEFCALELADGSIGLSYALLGDTLDALLAARPSRELSGAPVIEVARWFGSDDPLPRALGLAAINALSQRLFRLAGYSLPPARSSLAALDPRPGERIGMVGWFPPLTARILATGASLVVVELNASLAGEREGYLVTLDHGALGSCDKVISTTTLMLNDTLEDVLARCERASRVVLAGPGGGCLPDPLFARGVAALGSTAIVDRDGFVDALTRGAPWGAHARKVEIESAGYPGANALIERARSESAGRESARRESARRERVHRAG